MWLDDVINGSQETHSTVLACLLFSMSATPGSASVRHRDHHDVLCFQGPHLFHEQGPHPFNEQDPTCAMNKAPTYPMNNAPSYPINNAPTCSMNMQPCR
jgi:hypothetical protein